MDFISLAKKRYSCRNYQKQKVEQEKLDLILEAGRIAPTAANNQPQRILIVQTDEGLRKLDKAAKIFHAPLAIIVCADKGAAWVRPEDEKQTTDIDASIVTDHMMLAATDLGLATLWVGYFNPTILKKEFKIPYQYEPINILAVGYDAGEGQSSDRHNKTRKPLSHTVTFDTF